MDQYILSSSFTGLDLCQLNNKECIQQMQFYQFGLAAWVLHCFQGIIHWLVLFATVQLRPGKNTVCECVSVLINSLWSPSQRRLCAPNLELLLCATSVVLNVQREVHWIASFRADFLWTNSPQTLFYCLTEDIALHGNWTLCIVRLLKLLFSIQRVSITLWGEIA